MIFIYYLADSKVIYKNSDIAQEFNGFISDLSLPKGVLESESIRYIDKNFNSLKYSNKLRIKSRFNLDLTTAAEVFDLINAMDNSSSPGVTGWPVKLIKHCATNFTRLLSAFINGIFEIGQIPSEWKFAIVTPLYKV